MKYDIKKLIDEWLSGAKKIGMLVITDKIYELWNDETTERWSLSLSISMAQIIQKYEYSDSTNPKETCVYKRSITPNERDDLEKYIYDEIKKYDVLVFEEVVGHGAWNSIEKKWRGTRENECGSD